MKKYMISIEETIVQKFEVEAENDETALNNAKENYKEGIFTLEIAEVQYRQIAIVEPLKDEIEWVEF